MKKHVPEYGKLFKSKPKDEVAGKYRTEEGGHLLFRPIGQKAFARAARVMMDRGYKMTDAIADLSSIQMSLNTPPWEYVLWNPATKRINSKVSAPLPESILLFYVGQKPRRKGYDLLGEYRKALDNPEAELPSP